MRRLLTLLLLILICLPLDSVQGRPAIEPGLPLLPSWTSTGAETGSQHGSTVGIDGDYNGDGWNDLFIGAPKAQKDIYREGVVYVYQGGTSGLADAPHWTQSGGQQGTNFGSSVASAGDVNNDHADDLLVGAPGFSDKDQQLSEQGAVYLYTGGMGGLTDTPAWSFLGGQQGAWMGASVSRAGDVNGDTIEDVIVGASRHTNLLNNEGAVYMFRGSGSGLSTTPDWIAYGGSATATFGSSVAAAGDVNDDGYDDVIVGAPGYDLPGLTNCGAAFIFLGSEDGLLSTPAWSFYGEVSEAKLGTAVSGVGNVNHDRFDDFMVGAPDHSSLGFAYEGAAYLFLGDEWALSTTPHWTLYGGQVDANLGISLAAAGDLNQDTFADVTIGAYQYTDDHSKEGRTYVFNGSETGLQPSPSWWADGEKADATFGWAVAGNGDLNRDGYLDLVVGAPGFRVGEVIVGRTFVFYGVPEGQLPALIDFYLYLPVIIVAP